MSYWRRPFAEGRFEQVMALDSIPGGVVAAIWAYDVVTESYVEGRHPAVRDVQLYEVGVWRPRLARVDDDGTVRWTRSFEPFVDWKPQAVTIAGAQDGGAVAVFSMEGAMAVVRFDGDGDLLWSDLGHHADDAHGAVALADGSVVVFGDSARFSANASQGFAARYDMAGNEVWHRRFGEVDGIGAGALACPSGESCHLLLVGVDQASIVPPFAHAITTSAS